MTSNAWRLLVELPPRLEPEGAEEQLAGVAEALEGLGLPLDFVRRLQAALGQALHQPRPPLARPALRLRVWGPRTGAPGKAAPGAVDLNWGFFLVEKGADEAGRRTIELYLYRDGG
jgi:hypothetical protein